MNTGISDIEQDLIIERAHTAELQTKLKDRDNQIVELSYAVRTREADLKRLHDSVKVSCGNIKTLSAELLAIYAENPGNEMEARRRALAIAEIACGLFPESSIKNI